MGKQKFRVYRASSGSGVRRFHGEVPFNERLQQRAKAKRMIDKHEGYHPDNLQLQPYPHDAVVELVGHARRLGIQFKINGIPFGAPYDRALWDAFQPSVGDGTAHSTGDCGCADAHRSNCPATDH